MVHIDIVSALRLFQIKLPGDRQNPFPVNPLEHGDMRMGNTQPQQSVELAVHDIVVNHLRAGGDNQLRAGVVFADLAENRLHETRIHLFLQKFRMLFVVKNKVRKRGSGFQ